MSPIHAFLRCVLVFFTFTASLYAEFNISARVAVTNPAPSYKDFFGMSVAAVGDDHFLVGMPQEQSLSESNWGAAYLYQANGTLVRVITNPVPTRQEAFGCSVAALGTDYVVVGARGYYSSSNIAGCAYLFDVDGGLLATITNPTSGGGSFGGAVAAVGSGRFAVGGGGTDRVYLYDTSAALLTCVTNPSPEPGDDGFGLSVASLDPDHFLVGAPYDDTGATNAGSVYLYSANGNLLVTITNPTPEMDDLFGWAVAGVASKFLAVGALSDDTCTSNGGSVYLYDLSGSLFLTITNPAGAAYDWFGNAIAEVGDRRLLIGAESGGSQNTGAAWVFDLVGRKLAGLTNTTFAWDENFGHAVCRLGQDRFVMGVPYWQSGGSGDYHKQGTTYLYTFADGRAFYVNDDSLEGDTWCTAAGSDANSGTNPAAPKASIQSVLSSYALEPKDRIYVDTGNYLLTNNIEITSADDGDISGEVSIYGSSNGTWIDRGPSSASAYALHLNTAAHIRVSNINFSGGFSAIRADYSDHCTFSHVTVRDTGGPGVNLCYADGNVFAGLEIRNCAGAGVLMGLGSDNNTLLQSVVWSNASHGVAAAGDLFVAYSRSNVVENCTVAYNAGHQVHVSNLGSLTLRNSIVVASGISNCCVFRMDTYKGGSGWYDGDYNDLYAIDGAFIGGYSDWDPPPPFINPVMCSSMTDWQALFGQDMHSLSADPLFVNAGAGDFHLRSSVSSGTYVKAAAGWTNFAGEMSPCIDAGDPTAPYANEPPYSGSAVNLGAYGNTAEASKSRNDRFYVNDGSLADDVWCTAIGNDTNSGESPSSPKATVQAILSAFDLEPGDRVHIDTGYYLQPTNIEITAADGGSALAPVTLMGSPNGTIIDRGTNTYKLGAGGAGVYVNGADYVTVANLSITNAYDGLRLEDADSCMFSNMVVHHVGGNGLRSEYSCGNRFDGINVHHCMSEGLDFYHSSNNIVERGLIWSNWDCGIYISYSGSNRFDRCTIVDNDDWTQIISFGHYFSLSNSIVVASGAGNCCLYNYGGLYDGDYNNFYASDSAYGFDLYTQTSLRDWQARTGADEHSLCHDPLFADPANGDFHLRSVTGRYMNGVWAADAVHSPCIDAANPSAPFAGEPSPNGSRLNQGAYGNTAQASKSRTNAWLLAVSDNNGGRVSGMIDLRWNSGNIGTSETVRVEYSADAGASWTTLAASVSADAGVWSWNTALSPQSQLALWRVVLESDANVADTVDRTFMVKTGGLDFYVNDRSTNGDVYCSVPGNDSRSGLSPADPKATVHAVILAYHPDPGDTIYVDTGHYLQSTNIEFTSLDEGSTGGYVTVRGSPNGSVINRDGTGADRCGVYINNAEYVRLHDLIFSNGESAIAMRYLANYCVLSNIVIRGAGTGLEIGACNYNEFQYLDIRGCGDGIEVGNGNGDMFRHCVIAWNSGDGVHLARFSEGAWSYGTMRNCTIAYNGYKQIDLTGYYQLTLQDSVVVASGAGNACVYHYWQSWLGGHGSVWASDGAYGGDYNLLFAENGATIGGGYTSQGSNEVYAWTGSDENSVSAEPKFVDGQDLHLRSSAASGTYVTALGGWTNFPGDNSPAIDAGCPTNPCSYEPQWNGGIVNAGAYGNTPYASRSADSDGDWLSDSIEQYRYGSNPNDADSDKDGMGDRFEVLAGTCATNTDSVFESDGVIPADGTGSGFILQWPSAAGRMYRIQSTTDMRINFTNLVTGIPATPPLNTVTVTVTGVEHELFRVKLER